MCSSRKCCATALVIGTGRSTWNHEEVKAVTTILVIVLILLLLGALPSWPYSSGWGYYPSGGLGVVLLVVLILLLTGRI